MTEASLFLRPSTPPRRIHWVTLASGTYLVHFSSDDKRDLLLTREAFLDTVPWIQATVDQLSPPATASQILYRPDSIQIKDGSTWSDPQAKNVSSLFRSHVYSSAAPLPPRAPSPPPLPALPPKDLIAPLTNDETLFADDLLAALQRIASHFSAPVSILSLPREQVHQDETLYTIAFPSSPPRYTIIPVITSLSGPGITKVMPNHFVALFIDHETSTLHYYDSKPTSLSEHRVDLHNAIRHLCAHHALSLQIDPTHEQEETDGTHCGHYICRSLYNLLCPLSDRPPLPRIPDLTPFRNLLPSLLAD